MWMGELFYIILLFLKNKCGMFSESVLHLHFVKLSLSLSPILFTCICNFFVTLFFVC